MEGLKTSTINVDGFLSPEVQQYLNECRARYADWFQLVQSINRLAQLLLGEVRIDTDEPRQSIAGLLFARVLCHAQGAVLLIERCMPTQSEVLCRASLEALFGLLAVVEKPDIADLLVKADRYQRRDLLKARLSILLFHSPDADALPQVTSCLQEIEENVKRDPSPKEERKATALKLADRADQIGLYYSAYKLLSLPVHSNLRDLERQLGLDENGTPTSIGWGPTLEGLDHLLMTVAETLLRGVTAICRLFTLGHEEEIQVLRDRYAAQVVSVVGGA